MVPQVTVIGILMIVNGSLATLLGLLVAIIGPLMFSFVLNQGGPAPQQAQQVVTVVSIGYLVYGSLIAIAGIMNIAGGIAAIRFRSRNLVITALFFNILSLCSYCFPTSLGLMIWGLIVMFQGDVAHAFTLGASGYTADEIRQRMSRRDRYSADSDRDDWDERGRGRARADDAPRRDRDRPMPKGPPDDEHIYPNDDSARPSPPSEPPPPTSNDDRFYEK